ncbi:hypothetical protein PTKIN_Ptkin09bG0171700 [Pterospermum kingtungense]
MKVQHRNAVGEERVKSEAETRFKAKNGSVFPMKKKLVKKMMLDWLLKLFCFFFTTSISSQFIPIQMKNVRYC